ncbi:MAG: sugar phosphate isomerase/epimerase family protein [Opitutales bacterium]
MPFRFTGFADEAEKTLEAQISTLREVGWSAIELRLIDGKNVCDQTDDEWKQTRDLLQAENIEVVGFGGQIGNWARPITTDFQVDLDEIRRVAPRMRETATKFLRIMSYPNDETSPLAVDAWKSEVFRRLKELTAIAEGEGIVLAHENCNGYGATAKGYLEMVDAVNSPALQLILDTGNNSLHDNDVEVTWNYYKACRSEITHVHVKCAKPGEDGGDHVTCHVDEDPVQKRIFLDMEATGYDGWLSIEPHIKAAIHAGQDVDDTGEARTVWVEFGRRLEKLVEEL